MIVLGIDPGTASTGFGVVESAGSRLRALEDGVIVTHAGTPLERRLAEIHERVSELLDSTASMRWPSRSCTSAPTSAPRSRSGRRAGWSCSPPGSGDAIALIHAAAGQGRRVRPRTRRQGPGCPHGRAAARPPRAAEPDHAADALAVAICDVNRAPLARALAGAAHMIALCPGTVAVRRADHVVVDCGGVGYRLAVSAETLRHVPAAGRRCCCTPTSSCATTPLRSTDSPPRRNVSCS